MIRVEPAFHERAVPVAFSTDDNYAPLLAVAMRSALDNADPSFNYDILILNEGLAGANRERLLDPAGGNVSIRLVDMAEHMRGAATDFFVSRHIKIATYYRFFLPDILREYDKALYLDSDLVVLGDISALFATDLGDNLLAAAPEPIFMADVLAEERNNVAGGWRDYFVGTLGLRDPAAYVQAGVLVFNLAAMRRFGFADGCLDRLRTVREPVVHDQDILNAVCQGRILRLGLEWNHMCMAGGDGAGVGSGLPDDIRLELSRAAAAPKIIHYTTGDKAWLHRDSPYFEPFWRYAARTPFHGEHLARLERAERERAAPAGPERLRLVAKRHYDAFERYRDAHRGRDVVLIATGPSLARYRPFAGAIHLGVNRAFLRDDVRLDYLFVQPFFGSEIQAGRIAALGSVSPRKFHGMGLAGGQTAKIDRKSVV